MPLTEDEVELRLARLESKVRFLEEVFAAVKEYVESLGEIQKEILKEMTND